MIGILFGLAAMASWGIADFLAAYSSRKYGTFSTFAGGQLGGVLSLVPFLVFFPIQTQIDLSNWFWLGAGTLLFVIIIPLFYRALGIGVVAVISPILSSNIVITIAIGLFMFQEVLSVTEMYAVGLVTVGILFAASDWRYIRTKIKLGLVRGLPEAFSAMVLFGVFFSILAHLSWQVGWLTSILVIRTGSLLIIFLVLVFRWWRRNTGIQIHPLPFIIGVFDSLAYLSFNLGVQQAPLSIIAPISNSFSIITIILAVIFLREFPAKNQWVGIFTILIGVIVLAGKH
jgi:uncharacterized membrane protein